MNLTVDFILCFLFGCLGAHKFYEGKNKEGLLYLFTLGLFGIGWIIDTIVLFVQLICTTTSSNTVKNNTRNIINNYEYSIQPADNFIDNYVVFDLETTGLDAFLDEIIEIGALKYINNELVETFHEFIKPLHPISNFITNINGITNNDVKDARNIKDVLPDFIDFIESYVLIAHNNSFDLKFIMQNLKKQNIPCIKNRSIDTLSLARKYLPDLENHKLETLKTFLNMSNTSHRAVSDCEVTNAVYQYCKKQEEILNLNK